MTAFRGSDQVSKIYRKCSTCTYDFFKDCTLIHRGPDRVNFTIKPSEHKGDSSPSSPLCERGVNCASGAALPAGCSLLQVRKCVLVDCRLNSSHKVFSFSLSHRSSDRVIQPHQVLCVERGVNCASCCSTCPVWIGTR